MRRIFAQAFPLVAGGYLGQLALFALFALIARYRGDAFLGEFAVFSTSANIIGVIVAIGGERWILERSAQDTDIGRTVWSILRLNAVVACVVGLPIVLLMRVVLPDIFTVGRLPILWLWSLTIGAFGTTTAALHGRQRMLTAGALNAVTGLLTLLFVASLPTSWLSIEVLAAILMLTRLSGVVFALWRLGARIDLQGTFSASDYRRFAALCAFNLAGVLYQRLDTYLLIGRVSLQDIGQYAAAYRVLDALMLIPLHFSTALFASLVEPSIQFGRRLDLLRKSLVLGECLALALIIATVMFAGPVIVAVFGALFVEAGAVLTILVWGLMFHSANTLFNRWFSIAGRDQWLPIIAVVGILSNIALNIVCIPLYGIKGAAIATIGSFLTVTLAYLGCALWVGAFRAREVLSVDV